MSSRSLNKLGRSWRRQCQQRPDCQALRSLPIRTFATSNTQLQDLEQTSSTSTNPSPPLPSNLEQNLSPKEHALQTPADPNTASTRREERILIRQGNPPVGSRRRRAAVRTTQDIPFEQLPYQCFQEARKVLLEDRQQKIKEIETQRARIERLKMQDTGNRRMALQFKEKRLLSMMQRLEKLKVLADINDPLVKKRFEDGKGDLSRPIYRHLAKQKWLSRRYLILKQRLSQMHVYPDVLAPFEIQYDVGVSFGRKEIEPGVFVHSAMSEQPPRLYIQPFDKGERYVSVIIMDPDVPNIETDSFDQRCHFMAVNVPIGPTNTRVSITELMGAIDMEKKGEGESYESKEQETAIVEQPKRKAGDVIHPWLPPYVQKGSPYHRFCVIVLQHNRQLDPSTVKEGSQFDKPEKDVNVNSIRKKFGMRPVGGFLWRTGWDSGTDALMERLGTQGISEELKRKRIEPLPYKWRPSFSERYR